MSLKTLITSGINDWLLSFTRSILNALLDWANKVAQPTPLWHLPLVEQAHAVMLSLAWALLGLAWIWHAIRLYIIRDVGEDVPRMVLFRRTVTAIILMVAIPYIVTTLTALSAAVGTAIVGGGVAQGFTLLGTSDTAQALNGLTLISSPGEILIYLVIFGGIALGILILAFQALIRSVELAIAFTFGPVFAVSAIGADDMFTSGTFGVFWREVVVLATTPVIQLWLLKLTMGMLSQSPFLVAAAIWVAIKTPSILRQYAYSSGMKQAGGSGLAQAAMLAIKLAG